MPRNCPFKHLRFPRDIILCAVRWYLRYPLSYQDVVDLLGERGINVDRSTVYRWVIKFGHELTKRTEKHLRRVGGKWCYLWRAVDANGQMIDFRLTARRDACADAKPPRTILASMFQTGPVDHTVKIEFESRQQRSHIRLHDAHHPAAATDRARNPRQTHVQRH